MLRAESCMFSRAVLFLDSTWWYLIPVRRKIESWPPTTVMLSGTCRIRDSNPPPTSAGPTTKLTGSPEEPLHRCREKFETYSLLTRDLSIAVSDYFAYKMKKKVNSAWDVFGWCILGLLLAI